MLTCAGLTLLLLSCASGVRVSSPWRRRGVYPDRLDMPPLDVTAARLGVSPPLTAPKWVWGTAWRASKRALPLLHRWDRAAPSDTCVNLIVCWLKAIGGNRRGSGCEDDGLAYSLLPPITRRVVSRPLCYLYPPLHHQNIAMRTAFLDRAVRAELARGDGASTVVVLGAGFDMRPWRLMESAPAGSVWHELDLPEVVSQKRALLARAARRRADIALPRVRHAGVNLTDAGAARGALRDALRPTASGGRVVVVLEALLIYLPDAAAAFLLRACVDEAAAAGAEHVSLCFADRLFGGTGVSAPDAEAVLTAAGLTLDRETWAPKPGLARHMGVARWRRR